LAIAQAGGIAPLVELTRSGSAGAKEEAAGALWNLALNADIKMAIAQAGWNANNQAAIAQAGVIVTLVELTAAARAQVNAVGAQLYAVFYAVATLLAITMNADIRAAIEGYSNHRCNHLPWVWVWVLDVLVFWMFLLAFGLVWVCLHLACFWLLRAVNACCGCQWQRQRPLRGRDGMRPLLVPPRWRRDGMPGVARGMPDRKQGLPVNGFCVLPLLICSFDYLHWRFSWSMRTTDRPVSV
jgi:hypothetical protein